MVTTMEIPNRYRSKAFAEKARESARMAKALENAKREEQEAGRGTTYLLAVLCALVGISIFIKVWPWVLAFCAVVIATVIVVALLPASYDESYPQTGATRNS
ncbi:hypothetical protein HMPREF3155_01455 [Corynebacterium sp. HMSC06D04]|nr:hypothetical protein HMPREF3155_01455 [Corynebacterium sp. HMSC06D04]